jgi:hypothetical protein
MVLGTGQSDRVGFPAAALLELLNAIALSGRRWAGLRGLGWWRGAGGSRGRGGAGESFAVVTGA